MPGVMLLQVEGKAGMFDWMTVRAKGKVSFVFRYGIIRGGVPFALFMVSADYFRAYGLTLSGVGAYLTSVWLYLTFLFHCLFFGTGMGVFFWYVHEWGLLRNRDSRDSD